MTSSISTNQKKNTSLPHELNEQEKVQYAELASFIKNLKDPTTEFYNGIIPLSAPYKELCT